VPQGDSTDERGLTTQRWVYAGKALSGIGICHAWLGPDGERSLFTKVKGSVIGGIYEVQANDKFALPNPSWTGDKVDPERCLELVAESRAVEVDHARRQREKKEANRDELRELCAPLKVLMGKQIGRRRAALLAAIIDEITR